MPFAPAILASRHHDYLHNPKQLSSPYMMMTFDTRPKVTGHMIAALHPADLTSRAQVVPDQQPGLARVLVAYQQLTGHAVLLNTSLNVHGQPIARNAVDALAVFTNSGLQHLQLGPFLVHKIR